MLPLVVGNWKMNPQSLSLGVKLATAISKKLNKHILDHAEVVIAPPVLYLESIKKLNGKTTNGYSLGVQNAHYLKLGAFTGEISLTMLRAFGVSHVIVGHSERRALGETDSLINKKLTAVLKAGLTGILCVGEQKRDQSGHYLNHIEKQIRSAFAGIPRTKLANAVVAYEPLWAIGTGTNATPHDIHEMKLFIEKTLSDIYDRNYAQKIRIIYGGSVTKQNAEELHREGMMNGFLVGGASLHADEFIEIVKAVKEA